MKNSKRTFCLSLCGMLAFSAHTHAQMAVIDPSNLIENTVSAIQEKLSSGTLRDNGKINQSQLKADNQTVAEAIGIDDAVNTNLNLDMSHLKYTISPSVFFKSYLANKGFTAKLTKTKGLYNNSVSFYQSSIASLSPQKVLDGQKFLTSINDRITEISKNSNLAFNSGGASASGGSAIQTYDNAGAGSTSAEDAAYSAAEKLYETTVNSKTVELESLFDLKEKFLEQSGNSNWFEKWANFTSFGIFSKVTGKLENLTVSMIDEEINATKGALTQAGATFKESIGGSTLGSFGGTANQKGTGQKVTITAPNGVMNDNERVELLHEYLTVLDIIQSQLAYFNSGNLQMANALFNKTEMLKYQTNVNDLYKGIQSKKYDDAIDSNLDTYNND